MKLATLALTLFSIGSSAAFAMTPAFQVDYVNFAWGYDNRGCLVDQDRFIYKYAYGNSSDGTGLRNVGRVTEADFASASNLALEASSGKYTEKVAGADGGTTLWTATVYHGNVVKLKASGDVRGENDAPAAKELAQIIDGWCK